MILIAGITIAVFIEFLLIGKKQKSAGDVILGVWVFSITLLIFGYHIYVTGQYIHYPFILGVERPLPLLQGPFLYLYVAALTGQIPGNRKLLTLHFVPAFVTYLYLVPFFLLPAEQKIAVYRSGGAGYETFDAIRVLTIAVSGIVYVVWSSMLLVRHKRRILSRFSYRDKIDLQWLQILTWGLGLIWLLIAFSDEIISIGVVVFVFIIAFFGVRQSRIYSPGQVAAEEPKEKYAKSGLSDETSSKIYDTLQQFMEDNAPYRKNDLSIDELAASLNVHPNHLSQVINEREQNFYEFINRYRLEEFKKMAPANRHLTLLALAFECGFNSKSSFNRYFKKATGQTPSEYFSSLQETSD